MKLRKYAAAKPVAASDTRQEVRELAEALSLYGSAMRHAAERQAARPSVAPHRSTSSLRLGLLLAPALAAAVAAAVLIPLYAHPHHPHAPRVAVSHVVRTAPAAIDDTALMNQIDSELSEDVPDALQPLADLSNQATTSNASVSEKPNVTHE